MARIRVPMVTGLGGIQALAVTFSEVPGSYQGGDPTTVSPSGVLFGVPIGDPKLANVTVLVDVPDDEVNQAGNALDPVKVRAKYPGHPLVKNGAIK